MPPSPSYDIPWFDPPTSLSGNEIKAGHLYWAPIPLPSADEFVWLLQLTRQDHVNPLESDFYVQRCNIQTYDVSTHRPLTPLRLPREQLPIVVVYKIRPVIVLRDPGEVWQDGGRYGDDVALVLPICDVLDKAGSYRYSEEFLFKVQALAYPSLFHLPPSPSGALREGLVRLEWVQTVPVYHMRPYHDKDHCLALSEDAMWLLELWFGSYVGLTLPQDEQALLDDYRASKLRQMDELLAPS